MPVCPTCHGAGTTGEDSDEDVAGDDDPIDFAPEGEQSRKPEPKPKRSFAQALLARSGGAA